MANIFTAVPLNSPSSSFSITTLSPPLMPKPEWQEEMADMVRMYIRGEPIYVRYKTDPKRIGSIGRVKQITNINNLIAGRSWYHTGYDKTQVIEDKVKPENMDYFSFKVGWDGRGNRTSPSGYEVEWLKGYKGPTVWIYQQTLVPEVTAFDRLEREIKVGDFVCYILHHFGKEYGASTQFGTVTKISKDGNVYAKNVSLGSDEPSKEKKINDNKTIVILTKDLMDRLMMAKLANR